ncbi:hypothetical protein M2323_003075 [Rhodoblastus acidophilus]|uniref:hypothetical protein n=1 Tax=Rhodoblastus acidophilus TaxID=1074 RepID=UPI0022245C07|nr:hypothetical protein [Rhodoblastus acidophilus]MCW2285179.1 hypothetical protein [Rhodoblastus acidophilus]MCW2334135.1 hypothetical protein [Rhodoblastus acidophilus]
MQPGRDWRGPDGSPDDAEEKRPPKSYVFICCAPHGRVGVSTTARLWSDYFLASRRGFVGFDADPHEPDYAPRFSGRVQNVDLASTQGQIAMIDRLLVPDGEAKIIDLWSRSYDRFFTLIQDIGFVEEARSKNVEPIILFHADASQASPAAAWSLANALPTVETLLTYNEGAAPLGPDAHERLALYPPHRRLKIGALDALVSRALQPPDLSLSWFLIEPPSDMSLVVRAGLKSWMTPVFSQFRAFEMRRALEEATWLI